MVDVFLIVAIVVSLVLLFIVGLYLLVYYQHPDDKNEAWSPKLVVLFGFVLAGCTVLGLPLDVANNEEYPGCAGYDTSFCGGLNMELFWSIIFWSVPIWIFILIPFNTFYYEADDGMLMAGTPLAGAQKSRFVQACWNQLVVLIIIGLIFGLTYLFLGETTIPVQQYVGGTVQNALMAGSAGTGTLYRTELMENSTGLLPFSTSNLESITPNDIALLSLVGTPTDEEITVDVSVSTFYAGLMAWLGWFLFAIFGGIGIIAMPVDFFFTFKNRSRVMGAVELAEAKMELQERVNAVVEIGEQVKIEKEDREKMGISKGGGIGGMLKFNSVGRKEARLQRTTMREFQTAVYQLESDIEDYEACSDAREKYNPLVPYIAILLSFFSALISLVWLVQIIVYVLPDPPWLNFLNTYFVWFDGWFPLFGVLSVAIFTVYLLFCAVKGCFKFGMRFLLVSLHPMKPGRTYMSSFMFNTALVLFCALPVVLFCQEAFSGYAQNTTLRQIYGNQIENLKFFSYFFQNNVFIYAFLAIAGLTALYLACRPRDKDVAATALRKRVKTG